MPFRPFPPFSPATRRAGAFTPDTGPPAPGPRARAWACLGAGYLLFLGAHAAVPTGAAPGWRRPLLTVGALLLVAAGMRAWRAARASLGAGAERPGVAPPGAVSLGAVAPELAAAFVGRLYALGPAGWALVVARTRDQVDARAGARAVLCAVVADLGLGGAERRLAQSVATTVRWPGAERLAPSARETARSAALHAALAVLVRPSLPARDFDALYAPFASLIPAPASGGVGRGAAPRRS